MKRLIVTGFDDQLNYLCSRSSVISYAKAIQWLKLEGAKYFSINSESLTVVKQKMPESKMRVSIQDIKYK